MGTEDFSSLTREELEARLRETLVYVQLLEERNTALLLGQLQAVNLPPPPPPPPDEVDDMARLRRARFHSRDELHERARE